MSFQCLEVSDKSNELCLSFFSSEAEAKSRAFIPICTSQTFKNGRFECRLTVTAQKKLRTLKQRNTKIEWKGASNFVLVYRESLAGLLHAILICSY